MFFDNLTGGPDDPSISYQNNIYAFIQRVVKEHMDAFEPWKRINRYVYCINNPINYTDPLGLYEIDYHLDAQYVIYVMAGEPEKNAREIAFGSQYTDDSQETTAYTVIKRQRQEHHFASEAQIQAKYAEAGANPQNLSLLGSADHTRTDSRGAHKDMVKAGRTQHAIPEGTEPDKTYNDPAKALENTKETFRLAYERNHPNMQKGDWVNEWDKISATMLRAHEARTDTERWKNFQKLLRQKGIDKTRSQLRREYKEWAKEQKKQEDKKRREEREEMDKHRREDSDNSAWN